MTGAAPLHAELLVRLRAGGPIRFDEYMAEALYHPTLGYYCRPGASIGTEADFRTSPGIHPAFGRLIARQCAEIAHRAAPGAPLRLCEAGPGEGTLARDLALALRDLDPTLAARTTLTLVERSEALRATQRETLAGADGAVAHVEWAGWEDLVADPPRGGAVCVVANEFLDALPVRRLERRGGRFLEVFVAAEEDGLVEVLRAVHDGECLDHLARLERDEGVTLAEGQRIEVGLSGLDWITSLGRLFTGGARGGAILIDYGFPAGTLYHPARRDGMLMTYHRHRAASDPYVRPGEQDITCHVDFTSVAHRAREAGFDVSGPHSQMRFLVALGLPELFAARASDVSPAAIMDRLALHALMAPEAMGEIFKALMLTRGFRASHLAGARDPFRTADAADRPAAEAPAAAAHGGPDGA